MNDTPVLVPSRRHSSFTRCKLTLAATVTAVLVSVGISAGPLSAHHPLLDGNPTCPGDHWEVTWTVRPDAGRPQLTWKVTAKHRYTPAGAQPATTDSTFTRVGRYPNTQAKATESATATWSNGRSATATATVKRPPACTPPPSTTTTSTTTSTTTTVPPEPSTTTSTTTTIAVGQPPLTTTPTTSTTSSTTTSTVASHSPVTTSRPPSKPTTTTNSSATVSTLPVTGSSTAAAITPPAAVVLAAGVVLLGVSRRRTSV